MAERMTIDFTDVNTARMTLPKAGQDLDDMAVELLHVSRDIVVKDEQHRVLYYGSQDRQMRIDADFSESVPEGYRCIAVIPDDLSNVECSASGYKNRIMKRTADGPVATWQLMKLSNSSVWFTVYAAATRAEGEDTVYYYTAGATLVCVRNSISVKAADADAGIASIMALAGGEPVILRNVWQKVSLGSGSTFATAQSNKTITFADPTPSGYSLVGFISPRASAVTMKASLIPYYQSAPSQKKIAFQNDQDNTGSSYNSNGTREGSTYYAIIEATMIYVRDGRVAP